MIARDRWTRTPGRGHGHEFFEKSRTRTRGGQAADTRVRRSLAEIKEIDGEFTWRQVATLKQ